MSNKNKKTPEDGKIENNSDPNLKKKKKFKVFRLVLLIVFLVCIIGGGAVLGMVIGIIKSAPSIDPTNILSTLTERSVIVDENGSIIEQIHDPIENRDIVELNQIPSYLQNAFIAIEDHRFKDHFGIDLHRIMGSLLYNFKARNATAQGASTITQQLVKNLYLYNERKWERKIQEIYLAIKMEQILSKEQILENYLNTIPLGQSSYGVQAAAHAYFSKDVSELTLAESALLAGAAKSTISYAPFNRYSLEDINGIPEEDIVGYVFIGSVQYACVYNQKAINRQHDILNRMLDLEYISQSEYDEAINENMKLALSPGQTKMDGISSASTDYIKEKVIEKLMEVQGISYEQAENFLYKGGLTITTTLDVNMQKSLNESYNNFGALFLGSEPTGTKPIAQDWRQFRWSGGQGSGMLDSAYNILNENGNLIYFAKENILDEENNLYLNPDEYSYDEKGNLVIDSKKFDLYSSSVDIVNCYTIDEKLNFVSHNIGALNIGENYEIISQKGTKGTFSIYKEYVDKNPSMFVIESNKILKIPKGHFFFEEKGIVQPQSATVIIDYKTGKIKALIGGRNIEGSKTFNRATSAARQPGSTIKPLSVYLPALDLGYSAAYILDDVPKYTSGGDRWPKNWYEHQGFKYWGINTIRKSVEQSINTNAVTMLETIGLDASVSSLTKLGLIDAENPENDTFITPEENGTYNDLNLASLALGGLTKGFSPLAMTTAYGVIANDGVYIEPVIFTKITNSKGEVIVDNIQKTYQAFSPEVASLMKDILRTTVSPGLSYKAKLPAALGIDVAGKTGTTQANGDFWFVGFSPYYVGGIWVGNDNVQMKLTGDSGATARLWSGIMTPIHQGLAPAKFTRHENLIPVQVCAQSGKLPSSLCSNDVRGSQVITEYFVPGTQPTEICDIHVKVAICTTTNLLKSPYCPGNLVVERVFVQRKNAYNPDAKSGNSEAKKLYQQVLKDKVTFSIDELKKIYSGQVTFSDMNQITHVLGISVDTLSSPSGFITSDYQYQVPTQVCTAHTPWHYQQWINNNQQPTKETDESITNNNDDNSENDNNQENNQNNDSENNDEQNLQNNIESILDSIISTD